MSLRIKGLSRGYQCRGKVLWAVNGMDLSIRQGDLVNIIGRPGSRESTPLNMAAGLLMSTSDSIRLNSTELYALKDEEISELRNTRSRYIPQGLSTFSILTAFDNVRLPYFLPRRQGDVPGRASFLLDEVGIFALADMLPSQLSGGELCRVLIARALVNEPDILIVDESTSDLDIETTREIVELFARINKNGTTILIATHGSDTLESGNRVLTMVSGQLIEGSHLGSP